MRGLLPLGIICVLACSSRAEQVLMQNGDRYNGKIISLSTNTIVLQSDVIGTVTLPRSKVASLNLVSGIATNPIPPKPQPMVASGARTNSEIDAQLSQLASQTNLIQQVQEGFLKGATPAVSAKYNQMLNDLSTGKMSMNDLRAQAKDVAKQLRDLEKESGDDTGTLDMYLSVLDNFLDQTGSESSATNSPAAPVK